MQRVIVSKEEVEADLDRVRIEIVSTPIGVNSSNLGTICHKYVNGLRKFKFKPENTPSMNMRRKLLEKMVFRFKIISSLLGMSLIVSFLFQYKYLS